MKERVNDISTTSSERKPDGLRLVEGTCVPAHAGDQKVAGRALDERYDILCGDSVAQLKRLPPGCVQAVVTSPPYWGLRDYGAAGQIGREPTVDEYIRSLVAVFMEVRRVMRDDATLWGVIGDVYAAKRLLGLPYKLAIALGEIGFLQFAEVIWHKTNAMPENVRRRPARAHELVLGFAKNDDWYARFDLLREPAATRPHGHGGGRHATIEGSGAQDAAIRQPGRKWASDGLRNVRSVWTIPVERCPVPHPAAFPLAIPERIVTACTQPDDLVLDPFCGSGTVGVVALRHGRRFCGIELNDEYCEMARRRIGQTKAEGLAS